MRLSPTQAGSSIDRTLTVILRDRAEIGGASAPANIIADRALGRPPIGSQEHRATGVRATAGRLGAAPGDPKRGRRLGFASGLTDGDLVRVSGDTGQAGAETEPARAWAKRGRGCICVSATALTDWS